MNHHDNTPAKPTWLLSLAFGLAALTLIATTLMAQQVLFTESRVAAGLQDYTQLSGMGTGLAAADFDNDGWVDLFVPTDGVDHLYRNLGDGTFEEIAVARGLTADRASRAGLWFDYDGDNRLDLLVTSDCFEQPAAACEIDTFRHLYHQTASGMFEDVTAVSGLTEAGLTNISHRGGSAAADLNNDGFLDLVTSVWIGPSQVYLNQGDGTFVDVTTSIGVESPERPFWQPMILDYNGDGLVDIYFTVDFHPNQLWQHQGTGMNGLPFFTEVGASSGGDNDMNDMGIAVGDYDNDGDPDIYVTNIFRDGMRNVLLRSQSDQENVIFTELGESAGVDDGGWGWGATFFDADNDGDLDLAETNGWGNPNWTNAPRMYVNQGDEPPTFLDQAIIAGLTTTAWGHAILALDFDHDGDLDLVQTIEPGIVELYRNELSSLPGSNHNGLLIRPRMLGGNHRALGARVTARVGNLTLTRWITAGTSFMGQEPAEAFFGLGSASKVDQLIIRWPNQKLTSISNIQANQVVVVNASTVFTSGFESGDTVAWDDN